ncbi:hypothetical protein SISNIDRAFT_492057 [Sistotremastrum niveocremeum HHB9708]|uniref:Dynamin N-terminal domain-containing protein n=1 Tax=Sistotremastrum niveocremeum HHB9708 TaxID=1314777 RepID=A0A164M3W9_9AGAM|nr:hypothetical protein SISNIDRAFT_492057 [Sistotremastrum niveocremeum HHB9708]
MSLEICGPSPQVLQNDAELSPRPFQTFEAQGALKTGLDVAKLLLESVKNGDLGSKVRQDIWLRDLESFQNQTLPSIIIAVCGATGAGKSSLLNAILDDNIVPTSGMKACTSVVVEISYNQEPTIDADISFLTRQEWESELTDLLKEIRAVDGVNDGDEGEGDEEEAAAAFQKIRDVYPSLKRNQLAKMTPAEILNNHPDITSRLGTIDRISEPNSASFSVIKIKKYIENSLDGVVSKAKTRRQREAYLCPLIRLVQIRCHAAPLATGAVLVDLPGVADTNLGRVEVANRYLQKCDFLWIVAPITRAVNDKTAFGGYSRKGLRESVENGLVVKLFFVSIILIRLLLPGGLDGNYSDSAITFIATKTEDIGVTEIIRELELDEKAEFQNILTCLEQLSNNKMALSFDQNNEERALERTKERIRDVKDSLKNLKKSLKAQKEEKRQAKKRKRRSRASQDASAKRCRSTSLRPLGHSTDTVPETSDSSDLTELSSEDEDSLGSADQTKPEQAGGTGSTHSPRARNFPRDQIRKWTKDLQSLRMEEESGAQRLKLAQDDIKQLEREILEKEREKTAYCSLQRSDSSAAQLKALFRKKLRDMDENKAIKENPDTFDHTISIRGMS